MGKVCEENESVNRRHWELALAMKERALIKTLLVLRLAYYRDGVLERLRRFKLLLFFILAMFVPSVVFMLKIVQTASESLMGKSAYSDYFFSLLIFQLLAMLWVGSQSECLKLDDFEAYLRALKILDIDFFIIEVLFCFVINFPFIVFFAVGVFSLVSQTFFLFGLAHFIFLLISVLFLSICIIYSEAFFILLLIVANLILVYFNSIISCLFLSLFLGLISYFIVTKKLGLTLRLGVLTPIVKVRLTHFSPNIALNVKSLFLWSKVYTTCILGVNLLIVFTLIAYTIARGVTDQSYMSFFLAIMLVMFFSSLLIYKLSETRQHYGIYFSIFYNKFHYYGFDLGTIYIIVLFHCFVMTLVGFYLGFNVLVMLKSIVIALISVMIFSLLNRQFSFYGPVFSLLALAGVLTVSRGLM